MKEKDNAQDIVRKNPAVEKAEKLCDTCFHKDVCKIYERSNVILISIHDRVWEDRDCHLYVDASKVTVN